MQTFAFGLDHLGVGQVGNKRDSLRNLLVSQPFRQKCPADPNVPPPAARAPFFGPRFLNAGSRRGPLPPDPAAVKSGLNLLARSPRRRPMPVPDPTHPLHLTA